MGPSSAPQFSPASPGGAHPASLPGQALTRSGSAPSLCTLIPGPRGAAWLMVQPLST